MTVDGIRDQPSTSVAGPPVREVAARLATHENLFITDSFHAATMGAAHTTTGAETCTRPLQYNHHLRSRSHGFSEILEGSA